MVAGAGDAATEEPTQRSPAWSSANAVGMSSGKPSAAPKRRNVDVRRSHKTSRQVLGGHPEIVPAVRP